MTKQEKIKKLETLPWQALYDYTHTLGIEQEEIKNKDKDFIIQKIIEMSDLNDEEIEKLINDYIYGNRLTFTVWSIEKILNESEYTIITKLEGKTENHLECKDFRNLHIVSVKKCEDRFEIIYVYSKKYTYTDEQEKTSMVWELHRGCVWIGIDKAYVACISKHDKMTSCIINYLISQLKLIITQIKPPKSALEKCTNYRAMSRITLQSPDGEKTIISKSDGFTPNQEDEVARIKSGRVDTSGSYIAQISDSICATIKYNIKKGSIGIYKHLSATELFDWTSKAIDIILDEIEKLKGRPAEEIFAELGIGIKWNLLKTDKDSALNWFLTNVIAVQAQTADFQVEIPNFAKDTLYESKLFIKLPRIYCEECEAYDIPICAECGEQLNYNNTEHLSCICGAPLAITCGEGHNNCKQGTWFIPTEQFKAAIKKNYKAAFQGQDVNIYMYVIDDMLHINCFNDEENNEVEIDFDSIDTFNYPICKNIDKCKEYAVFIKEKCKKTCTNKRIQDCIRLGDTVCLPRIFYGILPSYRPQPHSGYEYGDVACQLKVGDRYYEMKGIIKSNTENKKDNTKIAEDLIAKYLLSTSKEGQEIIRQFVEQGLNDNRCQLIAIIAPQYFGADLKGTLRHLARLGKKKITFIGLDEIAKVIAMNSGINLV